MADLLLSALLPIVIQKSGDFLVQRIGEMWGVADKREKLHDKLLAVQAVLTDAEEQGNANAAVKTWLAKLKSAAYDADDVLDEFRYEELRRDAMRRGHKAGNVSGFFSLEDPVLFRLKMSRKLKEVVGRIDELVTEMERFKFVQGRQGRVVDRDRTHSYVIESELEGRGDDKENLVKMLTEVRPTENLTVLPVVGMGGLGKTTLAQLAYNDPRIKQHFKLLVWVCVSEEFDVARLAKLIIDSIVQGDCDVPRNNMELLQSRLRQEISGKRYLLVMDDVWNDNQSKWEQLRDLLKCGELGSTVLVTTRDVRVASITGTVPIYNLGFLGEEDSWSLFQKRAFSKGVKECPELVEIGKKLVKNCGGLPLAIKTLGSLMSYKDEIRQWSAVLEQSTIWGNKHANDNDGVLSVLRLSYDYLPSYIKQCFAFCAVFPKDHVMEREKLVHYWMAHGFIPSDGPGDLEMRGGDIFNELVWRSFFQDVEQVCRNYSEHGYRSQTTCKMHDLMHDLAQSVMRDECLSLVKPLQINNNLQCNMRHISMREFSKDINDVIQCYPAARTLVSNSKFSYSVQKIGFVKSNFLRVFDLSQCSLRDTMITPGKIKHLRYLHLSGPMVTTKPPEAITTLYLLQTLRLSDCWSLSELPKGMRYMMSLRHLHMEDCYLKCTPPGLGELKYLQTLTQYIVGTGVGNKIGELKTLNLGGQLEVYNLGEVGNAREAREVNMESKQNLDHLVLSWGMPKILLEGVRSNGSEAVVVNPIEVLDALKPCNKLKVFQIIEYRGDKFPDWMNEYQMLENLVELHIFDCSRRVNLPPLHRLPLLQILRIKYMDNLRHLCSGVITSVEGSEDAPITFPSLKSLDLYYMPNLDCWCEGDVGEKTSLIFLMLSELLITGCPKLNAIPVTPKLEKMKIVGNKTLSSLATGITNVRSLNLRRGNNAEETLSFKPWESLSLNPWVSLEELNVEGFNHIIPPKDAREGEKLSVDVNATALRKLRIDSSNFWFSSIPSNSPLWLWKCFTFLEFLYIEHCNSLTSWPEEELSNLNCLLNMEVRSCKNFLQSRSEPPPTMSSRKILLLPKLESLKITDCPNMVEVPKLPRSLEKLEIDGSKKLESLPEWLGSLVALKELNIDSCESLNSFPSSIGGLTALQVLFIDGCRKLESLPEQLGSLVALQRLAIISCESLNSLPSSIGGLTALQVLCIDRCRKLERLPERLGGLVALTTLRIYSCESLSSLPSSFTALEVLHICDCMNLASLPEGMQGLRSLDYLCITKCPLLEREFRKHGMYCHLISEIRYVKIGGGGQSTKRGDLTQLISSCKIPCLSAQNS